MHKPSETFKRVHSAARKPLERKRQKSQRAKLNEHLETLKTQLGWVTNEIDALSDLEGLPDEGSGGCSIVLNRGEKILWVLRGCALTEQQRRKDRSGQGYAGVSVHLPKGVTLHASGLRSFIGQGKQRVTIICQGGMAAVTNQRAVYKGPLHTREFRWAKLLAHDVVETRVGAVVQMPVKGRSQTSGISVGSDRELAWRLQQRVAFGVAVRYRHQKQHLAALSELADKLNRDITELERLICDADTCRVND